MPLVFVAESRSREADEVPQFISDGIVTLDYEGNHRTLEFDRPDEPVVDWIDQNAFEP